MPPKFSELSIERQTPETLARNYAWANALLDQGRLREAIATWDKVQREHTGWTDLKLVHYTQNTADEAAKKEKERADTLLPIAEEHNVKFLKRLLEHPDRAGIIAIVGDYAITLWEMSVASFNPAIANNMTAEEGFRNQYMGLLASAKIPAGGKMVSLSGLAPYSEDQDRKVRYDAQKARWNWFAQNGKELDTLYDDAVKNRHDMATKLGYENYIPLAYKLMGRTDFGAAEIAAFRDDVLTHIVPLVSRIMNKRGQQAGLDHLYFWDEALSDPLGNPKPAGGHDLLLERAKTMFANVDARLLNLYETMLEGGFIDLESRDGKKHGGYCTSFPTTGQPFIFGNFNGTIRDTEVFSHEMGHAFQRWLSGKKQRLAIYHSMARDACETPSFGLEFLCSPHIAPMLEEGVAGRYRHMHLEDHIAFLPYCVCVDHFQHEIYANPQASPEERHEVWRKLENQYTPWVDYGDLAYPAMGGGWQAQPHLYIHPFYYLNYGLDLIVALQFKADSEQDYKGTFERFVGLCERGGSAPFLDLVRGVGLVSPFESGLVAKLANDVASTLGVSTALPFGDRPGRKVVVGVPKL